MSPVQPVSDLSGLDGLTPSEATPAPMGERCAAFDARDRTTADTYVNDKVVLCVSENALTESEEPLVVAPLAAPASP